MTLWLAPILVFTCEEAWASREPGAHSVHLEQFPLAPAAWRNEALAKRWEAIRRVRSVVTGALEKAREVKAIGSSLEAAPRVYVEDPGAARTRLRAWILPRSASRPISFSPRARRRTMRFACPRRRALQSSSSARRGSWNARASWRYFDPATVDPDYPDVTPRDAAALRELGAARRA